MTSRKKVYTCETCSYSTKNCTNYKKHLDTIKHWKNTQNLVVENTTDTENPDFKKKYDEAQHNYIEILKKYTVLLETTHNQS